MEKRILEIKHQARNVDLRDLRRVVANLADLVLEVYKSQNAKEVPKKGTRKPTRAKVKTLANN